MSARRPLQAADLELLTAASAEGAPRIYRLVEALAAEAIGHRLFTIMRFDPESVEVERVHSSAPDAYPVGGRKPKADTAWADHTLLAMQVFRAASPQDIRANFDDHATILGLGLGSILNVPIVADGRCVGTMNLCHRAGWYVPEDECTGLALAPFLVPALSR